MSSSKIVRRLTLLVLVSTFVLFQLAAIDSLSEESVEPAGVDSLELARGITVSANGVQVARGITVSANGVRAA